jgi:hypothetical protein
VISLLVLAVESLTSYIDANTGSYLFQIIVGGIAGAAMAVGVFWRRIFAFFGRRSRKG